ncbi:hypothetical protein [Paenibacillus humicus]|uniref:hypothetical protein n=1 Tax=Paenibacillus humicus TaxID=412861 RepID=UPI003F18F7C3
MCKSKLQMPSQKRSQSHRKNDRQCHRKNDRKAIIKISKAKANRISGRPICRIPFFLKSGCALG